jgi:phage tail-like protein
MTRQDPLRNFRFRLEIDGIQQAGFSEVSIAETTVDVIEYREGNEPAHARKLSGLTRYGNVTLKWGVTDSLELWNWFAAITQGDVGAARRDLSLVVLDEAGDDKARFRITDAWPVKYRPSDLKACGNDVLIEIVELTNEGIERIS